MTNSFSKHITDYENKQWEIYYNCDWIDRIKIRIRWIIEWIRLKMQ